MANKPPTFKTRRLVVRPWRKSDLEDAHALYSDGANLGYWNVPAHKTLAETRRTMRWHIAYQPQFYAIWAVEEKKTGRVIGMVNYHHRFTAQKRVDVGWLIRRDHQRKGLTAEAMRPLLRYLFRDLGLHKVEALIMPANKASQALARRLGFRKEGGPIRDRWHRDGRWHSVLIYGLVAGEQR
ncbi:MAG TPA: GNAT family N-acetyltransferase [Reyranellaceae bacterium]|nr:GNAT family N-acetyltransferase [Reyranellaceae bacterium]